MCSENDRTTGHAPLNMPADAHAYLDVFFVRRISLLGTPRY